MVAHQQNRVKDEFFGAMQHPEEMLKEYPLPSMLLMFGLGIGVGVLVSHALCSTLMDTFEEPTMTEKVKRQLYDAVSSVVPPSMLKQLQHYTS